MNWTVLVSDCKRCDAVTCVSTLDSCLRLRMAPCYVVRVSVSRGSEPDKDAGKPLLIRLSWIRPPHIQPNKLYEH